jgi:hypothetical protein
MDGHEGVHGNSPLQTKFKESHMTGGDHLLKIGGSHAGKKVGK